MSRIALLDHLHEPQPVRLEIPLKDGGKARYRASAQLRDTQERTVTVDLHQVSVPPIGEIDFRSRCTVRLDSKGGPSLSMHANLEEVLGDRRVLVRASDYVPYQPKRSTFRVEAEIPVQYKRYYREQEPFRRARSEDLSSGGVRILCDEDLQTGNVLTMSLEVPRPKKGRVLCSAQVMWTGVRHDGSRSAGCKFLDLDEASEDLIIAFCFERQRELMQEKVQTADR